MKLDGRYQTEADRDAEAVTRFLADLISMPSLSRDENAVVQRIGHEMTQMGFDEVIVDGLVA